MGGRYFISGTQLGLLLASAEQKDYEYIRRLLLNIQDIQYLGDFSSNSHFFINELVPGDLSEIEQIKEFVPVTSTSENMTAQNIIDMS